MNGIVLVNADHDEAISVVRNAAKVVQIVACRDAKEGEESSLSDGHTTETAKCMFCRRDMRFCSGWSGGVVVLASVGIICQFLSCLAWEKYAS